LLVRIENFKSINRLELELAPLTILVGPPASGKSNILDALALLGYFNRIKLLDKEYDNNASNLEPLTFISRFTSYQHLFTNYDLTKRISVEMQLSAKERFNLTLQFMQGKLSVSLNNVPIPWDLQTLPSSPFGEVRNALNQVIGEGLLPESRLYGYDRYGLATQQCVSSVLCGFNIRLRGMQAAHIPKNILSEFSRNAPHLTRLMRDIISELNDVLREYLNMSVEVKVSLQGTVMIFDNDYEIEPTAISDTLFRALYYLMAIKTSLNYVKLYGLEKRFILLFEEPEAHVFPYFLEDLLADHIAKAVDYVYVVIATHNPLLVSILWDKVKNAKTYYVARDESGFTRSWEIDVEALAKDLKTAEEVLFMPPREVIEKYTVKPGGVVERKAS